MSHILGAVLAGGHAQRFGSDKALAVWQGRPLIEHAAAALADHVDSIVIVGREHPGFESIPDLPRPGAGPLGGVSGALAHAVATGARSVLTVPCDVPAPPPELMEILVLRPCWCEDHPVFGHWPCAVADLLFGWMTFREERSVRGFAAAAGLPAIASPAPIRDVDTPDDLALL